MELAAIDSERAFSYWQSIRMPDIAVGDMPAGGSNPGLSVAVTRDASSAADELASDRSHHIIEAVSQTTRCPPADGT